MKQFKNILYYTNGNEAHRPALKIALELARRNHASLTVANVLEHPSRHRHILEKIDPAVELHELAIQDAMEKLDHLVRPLKQDDTSVTIEILFGTPCLEIIRAVLTRGYDLVMLTAEGTQAHRPILKTQSLRLLRMCPCPVWVINESHRRFRRIMAAVNPDPCDEEHQGVNTRVMELAASLARLEGSELHIVHAWNVPCEDALRRWHKHLPSSTVDRIVSETEATHRSCLDGLLANHSLRGIPHKILMERGEHAEKIISLSLKNRIDLLIMGTVGRTGIPGFIIGNTAETVLSNVQCSVLAVKPDGFVTPVKPAESAAQA